MPEGLPAIPRERLYLFGEVPLTHIHYHTNSHASHNISFTVTSTSSGTDATGFISHRTVCKKLQNHNRKCRRVILHGPRRANYILQSSKYRPAEFFVFGIGTRSKRNFSREFNGSGSSRSQIGYEAGFCTKESHERFPICSDFRLVIILTYSCGPSAIDHKQRVREEDIG